MFSIALNGYDSIYRQCIESHRRYAFQNSYEYVLVNKPDKVDVVADCAWLKIPLILEGLRNGYEWVFFIDADCEVRSNTPRIESIEVPQKSIYLAYGHSNRFNSGVIITKNTAKAKLFFQKVLETADIDVPEEDKAPYENGHIIHYAKGCEDVSVLNTQWNNTTGELYDNDYIRHYTGPMKQYYTKPSFAQTKVKVLQTKNKIIGKLANKFGYSSESKKPLKSRLERLTKISQNKFPAFMEKINNQT